MKNDRRRALVILLQDHAILDHQELLGPGLGRTRLLQVIQSVSQNVYGWGLVSLNGSFNQRIPCTADTAESIENRSFVWLKILYFLRITLSVRTSVRLTISSLIAYHSLEPLTTSVTKLSIQLINKFSDCIVVTVLVESTWWRHLQSWKIDDLIRCLEESINDWWSILLIIRSPWELMPSSDVLKNR